FIKGERSNYITSEDKALIEKHFPQATVISIPEAGHWVHAENKDAFYETVMNFV
ncbi:alpha/beta hydrolase, partial [Tamlana crocina]|nr:alpha/beta hydrolase [Tamlana crocina]